MVALGRIAPMRSVTEQARLHWQPRDAEIGGERTSWRSSLICSAPRAPRTTPNSNCNANLKSNKWKPESGSHLIGETYDYYCHHGMGKPPWPAAAGARPLHPLDCGEVGHHGQGGAGAGHVPAGGVGGGRQSRTSPRRSLA